MRKRSVVIATIAFAVVTLQAAGCGGMWSGLLSQDAKQPVEATPTDIAVGMDADTDAGTETPTEETKREDVFGFGTVTKGDYVSFGTYEQDNDLTNGTEPIEWKVMAVEDDRALLMSVYSLENMQFHSVNDDVTWEDSELRYWMNHDFYDNAFTDEEKEWISLSHLLNPGSQFFATSGGNATEDYVFTVSLEEIQQYFPLNYNMDEYNDVKWMAWSEDLLCEVTPYALAKSTRMDPSDFIEWDWDSSSDNYYGSHYGFTGEMILGKDYDEWWTRTPGKNDYAAKIYCMMYVYNYGITGCSSGHAMVDTRPVRVFIWVDIE